MMIPYTPSFETCKRLVALWPQDIRTSPIQRWWFQFTGTPDDEWHILLRRQPNGLVPTATHEPYIACPTIGEMLAEIRTRHLRVRLELANADDDWYARVGDTEQDLPIGLCWSESPAEALALALCKALEATRG